MEGVRKNEFTYVVAVNNYTGLAALKNVNALCASAMKPGHWGALFVCNALIKMYSKSGSIHHSRRVFLSMPCRGVVSWNSMVIGYAHHVGC
jgi:pentatricopeptide repeat protein